MMIELLKNIQSQKIRKRNSWRDLLGKWFLLPRKGKFDLVRKNKHYFLKKQSEKGTKQKNDRTKKSFTKRDEQFKSSDFASKKRKINVRDSN